jgi:hypothetical protein
VHLSSQLCRRLRLGRSQSQASLGKTVHKTSSQQKKLNIGACASHLATAGRINRRITDQAGLDMKRDFFKATRAKRAGDVGQEVECPPSKSKSLTKFKPQNWQKQINK